MGSYVDFDTFSIHWIFNELFVTVMCHFFSEKIENSIYNIFFNQKNIIQEDLEDFSLKFSSFIWLKNGHENFQ